VLNDGMVNDIKALLDAFDIPYISAPYEAEAQCAFLEMVA
jgi:5'-3' exonuclease